MQVPKEDMISQMQKDILLWEGFKPPVTGSVCTFGLGAMEAAFPNGVFPTGAVHEFLSTKQEHTAATGAFISGLLGMLMQKGGACLWISRSRRLFPPALKFFGIVPHQVIFVDLQREKDVLWATEEALKCEGLAAVVAEVQEITFMQSRRLQLAVETSRVTGFIMRSDARKISATACTARWKITPLVSEPAGLPGVGFPRWQVELLKVRNGKPGSWQVEWAADKYHVIDENNTAVEFEEQTLKAG
jgi:protein ImuA